MALMIQQAGSLCLLQDSGRSGYQHIGVTQGGAMDLHAFRWANRLLDNSPNAAQIEITMGPFKAEFQQASSFALCGSQSCARLNGQEISNWSSHRADCGDRLEVGYPKSGLRTYLAIKGGFNAPQTLGSVSTVVRDQLGGLNQQGAPLKAGDQLAYHPQQLSLNRTVANEFIPEYPERVRIGILPTYQFEQFSPQTRESFFNQTYTVSPQSDRMGYRLQGEPVLFSSQLFISEGIAAGAIQIPANGQPIILMRDRQTIGGYPKLGCVCQRDLNLLAQCRPGTKIEFFLEDIEKAEAEMQKELGYFLAEE